MVVFHDQDDGTLVFTDALVFQYRGFFRILLFLPNRFRRIVLLAEGEGEGKDRTDRVIGFYGQVAFMDGSQVAGIVEADAETGGKGIADLFSKALVTFENPFGFVRRDTDARICHFDEGAGILRGGRNGDFTVLRRIFDSIAEQVEDDAFHFLSVAVYDQFRREVGLDAESLLLEHIIEILHHAAQHDNQVGLHDAQAVTVGAGLVEMQQLVGQAQHPLGIPFDELDQVAVLIGQRRGALQFPHRSVNQGKRSAEFVGDVGEEGGTLLADLLDQLFLLFRNLELFAVDLQVDELADTEGDQAQ